jgi:hypothetical protein
MLRDLGHLKIKQPELQNQGCFDERLDSGIKDAGDLMLLQKIQ